MTIKIQQFQLSKNEAKQHVCKSTVYCEPGPSSKAESTEDLN